MMLDQSNVFWNVFEKLVWGLLLERYKWQYQYHFYYSWTPGRKTWCSCVQACHLSVLTWNTGYMKGRGGYTQKLEPSWMFNQALWRRMSHRGSSVGRLSSSEPAAQRNHHLFSLLMVRHSWSGWTLHDPLRAVRYGHRASRGAKVTFWLGFTSKNFTLQDHKQCCDIYMTPPRIPHDHEKETPPVPALLQASQRAQKTFQTVPTPPPNTTTTTVTDWLECWSFQQTL